MRFPIYLLVPNGERLLVKKKVWDFRRARWIGRMKNFVHVHKIVFNSY
jgi:hypothetical protein